MWLVVGSVRDRPVLYWVRPDRRAMKGRNRMSAEGLRWRRYAAHVEGISSLHLARRPIVNGSERGAGPAYGCVQGRGGQEPAQARAEARKTGQAARFPRLWRFDTTPLGLEADL